MYNTVVYFFDNAPKVIDNWNNFIIKYKINIDKVSAIGSLRNENYFNYIFSYVHLNPIKLIQSDWKENGILDKVKANDFLKEYHYSSFKDYFGLKRKQEKILNMNAIPDYFLCHHKNDLFYWFKKGEWISP